MVHLQSTLDFGYLWASGVANQWSDVVLAKWKAHRKGRDRLAELLVELLGNAAVHHDKPGPVWSPTPVIQTANILKGQKRNT